MADAFHTHACLEARHVILAATGLAHDNIRLGANSWLPRPLIGANFYPSYVRSREITTRVKRPSLSLRRAVVGHRRSFSPSKTRCRGIVQDVIAGRASEVLDALEVYKRLRLRVGLGRQRA